MTSSNFIAASWTHQTTGPRPILRWTAGAILPFLRIKLKPCSISVKLASCGLYSLELLCSTYWTYFIQHAALQSTCFLFRKEKTQKALFYLSCQDVTKSQREPAKKPKNIRDLNCGFHFLNVLFKSNKYLTWVNISDLDTHKYTCFVTV